MQPKTEFGKFLRFETLTLCPIDTRPIVFEILTRQEVDGLNAYHSMVYDRLSPLLNTDEKKWLSEKTANI